MTLKIMRMLLMVSVLFMCLMTLKSMKMLSMAIIICIDLSWWIVAENISTGKQMKSG
jgi:hypothetical protein